MISENQITFVVQGQYSDTTKRLLDDIRQLYPKSFIILSVWKGTKISSECFDKLIESVDPGGFLNSNVYLNVNRQIVSAYNGICEVDTEFCIKLRSDMRISSAKIVKELEYSDTLFRAPVDNKSWVVAVNLTT